MLWNFQPCTAIQGGAIWLWNKQKTSTVAYLLAFFYVGDNIHSLQLTVRLWRIMLERLPFPFGIRSIFSGYVSFKECTAIEHLDVSKNSGFSPGGFPPIFVKHPQKQLILGCLVKFDGFSMGSKSAGLWRWNASESLLHAPSSWELQACLGCSTNLWLLWIIQ